MDLSARNLEPPDDDEVIERFGDRDVPSDLDEASEGALDVLGAAAAAGYRWRALVAPSVALFEVVVTRALQEARRSSRGDRAATLAEAARRCVAAGLPFWRGEDAPGRAAALAERLDVGGPEAAESFLLGVALRDCRLVLDKVEGRTGPTGFGGG